MFYIGKVNIEDQGTNAKITGSTKIIAGMNWNVIWPIVNSTNTTFYFTTHRNDIASVRNAFNWSTVLFILLFSLIFILIWLWPIFSSYLFMEKEK